MVSNVSDSIHGYNLLNVLSKENFYVSLRSTRQLHLTHTLKGTEYEHTSSKKKGRVNNIWSGKKAAWQRKGDIPTEPKASWE